MSRIIRGLVVTAVVSLVTSCSDQPGLTAAAPSTTASASIAPGNWARVIDGTTGPGSSYRIYMPATWNGKLVVYAHGVVPPFLPVTLPSDGDTFAALFGARGFAVAFSSFSETGFAIKDGAQRTHQLSGIFASEFGQPARTYLVGSSLGGFVVTSLAERFPTQYDGVMPVCGVVGGWPSVLAYLSNARLLFDALYPGILPGDATNVPMPSDPAAAVAAIASMQASIRSAFATDARPINGALQIALIDQMGIPLPTPLGPLTQAQFAEMVATPLLRHAIFVNDVLAHTHGHIPFSNIGTTYTSSASFMAPFAAALNASVARYEGDKDAINWVEHNGETTGRIGIPTLTLHNRFDPTVPIFSEAIYRQKAQAAGRADLLVQRTTNGFGHCNFTGAELATGFANLVGWVEGGVKPTP